MPHMFHMFFSFNFTLYTCFSFFPGLFPAVLNLASMADITANATCGSHGPEMFCKLVEHVPGQPVRNPQCRICNQRSTKPFGRKTSSYTCETDKILKMSAAVLLDYSQISLVLFIFV